MAKFYWKTEGTMGPGTICRFPASVMLLIIIALAVGVSMLCTGKVSEQEKAFQARQAELEAKMSNRENVGKNSR